MGISKRGNKYLRKRLIHGARVTIFVALAASVLAFTLGAFLGFLAAVRGGWIDQVLSRLVDLVMSVPSHILALVRHHVARREDNRDIPTEAEETDTRAKTVGFRLRLPGLGMLLGKVVWNRSGHLGGEFINPVSPSRLRLVLGYSPISPAQLSAV